jgi:hypothetical protein
LQDALAAVAEETRPVGCDELTLKAPNGVTMIDFDEGLI